MTDNGRPSVTALVTAACFAGPNLAVALAGGLVSMFLLQYSSMLSFVALVATGATFVGRVLGTSRNPAFIARVAREDLALPQAPGARVIEALGGAGLTGSRREEFNKVARLKDDLIGQIRRLPEGPAKVAFLEFVPRLDDVSAEVHRLVSSVQRIESELTAGAVETLEKEITGLEAWAGKAQDPEERAQFESAITKKREAITYYRQASDGLGRANARVEAIIAALQQARARVTAVEGRLIEPSEITEAKRAVEVVSQEVEYLSQAVEETNRLRLTD
jgi:hypothetical protein